MWVWAKEAGHASPFPNLAGVVKLECTKEFVDAFKWRTIVATGA
jgi:hypothetical protein